MVLHLLLCVLFIVFGIVVAWQRSLIPLNLHGEVAQLTAVEVDQPGVDDWVQFHIGDSRYPTINSSLTCIGEGAAIDKAAWSRESTVNGHSCRLPFPRQAVADTVIPVGLLALAVLVVPCICRRGRSVHDGPGQAVSDDETPSS